ncbi:alkaline phosphatase [Acetobacterium malicum]|uniref:Alkaline phosphatase n=1 Tax=Acetobacterium malicum TaxID=52692 RepID=A0ABR6YTK1_9FIRM|nr:alkaline phosphatase [Acetobacterium malicum]MBC3898493.1 alkaline phosphatase [Acetobacterium malicum]
MNKTKKGVVLLALLVMGLILLPACVNAVETESQALVFQGNYSYQTHIQNVGWQDWQSEGSVSGTTGRSLRLEGIKLKVSDHPDLGITYQTHVQNIGWQNWVSDGAEAGTSGRSLRMEAIRINLTGTEAENYDVYYQAHVQNRGWMTWVKNGELAGTEGLSYRMEAIRMMITPKGTTPPDDTATFKNVILLIADGGGANHIMATDYFTNGQAGTQVYEDFPARYYVSTYSTGKIETEDDARYVYDPATIWGSFDELKSRATDSAAAATAMATGTKTYNGAIGVDPNLKELRNLTEDFEEKGKSTGVVTSVELSHATPAAFVAHDADRRNYSGIANEMISESSVDVIMGAGNPLYNDDSVRRSTVEAEYYQFVGGKETWEALEAGALGNDADGDGDSEPWQLIQTKADFEALQSGDTPDRVIGVPPVYTTLQYGRAGDLNAEPFAVAINNQVPSLATMARASLNVLDNNEAGFFLMIEGGAVDWAASKNQSGRMIEEEADFNQAAAAVCDWVEANSSWSETLVIVTSDHETGYLTGNAGVYNEVVNNGQGNMPTMVWNSEGHTNQLVPIFAKGPGADLFQKYAVGADPVQGAYINNTDIPRVIRELLE